MSCGFRSRFGRSAVAVGAFLAVVSGWGTASAQFGGIGGGGFGRQPEPPPAPKVYVARPLTEKSAEVWAKLARPITVPFENDTPLGDVLMYVRQATADDAMKGGIPIYVDPVGLQEAEQTLQSPISGLALEGIPLAQSLKLALGQLRLGYAVTDDGLVTITSIDSLDAPIDPMTTLLDEVRALREDIAELKKGQDRAGPAEAEAKLLEELRSLRKEVEDLRRRLDGSGE